MSSPSSVSYEIAGVLRGEILRVQYRPGERLPSERDLSTRFSVSRGVVREALSQLEQQGIIETQPGGVRVKHLEDASLAILGPLLALREVPDPELVDQFLEIFSVLTGLTARYALTRANDEQMRELERLLKLLSGDTSDFEAMQPNLQNLLEFMASISNNLVVRFIGNDVKAQVLGRMMSLDIKPKLPSGAGQALVNDLWVAIRDKDGTKAAAAFERHFDLLRVAMQDALAAMQSEVRRVAV
jgi:DNA-binding FadR family transcriptional regulator